MARDSRPLRLFVFDPHAADRLPKRLDVVVVIDCVEGAVVARRGHVLEN
jgi:hypothetical protein